MHTYILTGIRRRLYPVLTGHTKKAVSRPPLKDAGARSALSSDLGLGTIPLPQNVFCDNLLECHDKTSGYREHIYNPDEA
jgi:hypothetical protein